MLSLTLADLRFRARQFLIAVVGTAVVLGLALVMSGLAAGFTVEVNETVQGLGATSVVMAQSAAGRLTAFAAFPESYVALVGRSPGTKHASPFLLDPNQLVRVSGASATVEVAGVELGGLGDPLRLLAGRPISGPHQVVVDDRLHVPVGSRLAIGEESFTVVGVVGHESLLGGFPIVFTTLASAQSLAAEGRPLVTAVLVRGVPGNVPRGLAISTPAQVAAATGAQMHNAIQSIRSSEWLMWTIAVIIVAALLYVVALERRRDFAVLKALGCSSSKLFQGLVAESVVVTLLASLAGMLLSILITPLMEEVVAIPVYAYVSLPLIAIVIGAIASLAALRRVTNADPAAAFG